MKAAINVIGPNGELVTAGNPIPDDWPNDVRASLLATGGAEPEAADTGPADTGPEEEVTVVEGTAEPPPGPADRRRRRRSKASDPAPTEEG